MRVGWGSSLRGPRGRWPAALLNLAAGALLLALAYGFAPLDNNLLGGSVILGVPVWLSCLLLGIGLVVEAGTAVVQRRAAPPA